MSVYVEAMLLLLPPDAGGRTAPVAPREGSYRPFARLDDGQLIRAVLFEGPPLVAPGDAARVILEVEADQLRDGDELALLELDQRVVGSVTVLRVCGRTSIT